MRILLIYRRPHERLEEALRKLVHSVSYNLWDIKQFLAVEVDAVIFETKQILKRKCKFLLLTWQLKKYGIPGVTWCADLPNFGVKIYVNRTPEEKKLTRRFMDLLGIRMSWGAPKKIFPTPRL